MPETTLGNAVEVLGAFGFFDVILPFLLVFTITFGVLEKSNLFGTGKKNLNSMIAFSVGFLVIAATQITTAIQLSVPKVAFMLLILISFLLLVGSLLGPQEKGLDFLSLFGSLKTPWLVVIAVAILAIFLSSVGWLEYITDFFNANLGDPVLSSLVFIVVMVAIIAWITKKGGSS